MVYGIVWVKIIMVIIAIQKYLNTRQALCWICTPHIHRSWETGLIKPAPQTENLTLGGFANVSELTLLVSCRARAGPMV